MTLQHVSVVDNISVIWFPFDLIRASRQILNFWWHACCTYRLQFLDDSRDNRMSRTRNISRIREDDIFSEYFYWPIWKNLFSTSYGFTWTCLKNWWERNVDLNVAILLEFCIYVISMDNEYLEKKMCVYKINAILRIIGIIVYRFQKENSYLHKAIILLNIKCNSFTFDL